MTSFAMPTGGEYVVKANSKFNRVCSTDTPSEVMLDSGLKPFIIRTMRSALSGTASIVSVYSVELVSTEQPVRTL